jgi:proteasome component ECM29
MTGIDAKEQIFRSFSIRFISRGITRLITLQEKEQVLKTLIADASHSLDSTAKPGQYLFHFLLRAIAIYQIPKRTDPRSDGLRDRLGVQQADGQSLSNWFARLLLVPASTLNQNADPGFLPGLSAAEVSFVLARDMKDAWDPKASDGVDFSKTKSAVFDFVDSTVFTDDERLLPYLCATTDTCSVAIADRGKDYLKVASRAKIDDQALITSLYSMYLGQNSPSDPQRTWPRVSISVCTRILTLLTRTTLSVENIDLLNELVHLGMADQGTGVQARRFNSAFMAFVPHAFRLLEGTNLKLIAGTLVEVLREFLDQQGWPKPSAATDLQTRRQTYEMVGRAIREGSSVDIYNLQWIISSLIDDTSGPETTLSIEQAVSDITQAFSRKSLGENETQNVATFLLSLVETNTADATSHLKNLHFIVARLANRSLPFWNLDARYIDSLVIGTSGRTVEAAEEGRKGLNPYWFRMLNSHRPDLWSSVADGDAAQLSKDFRFPSFQGVIRRFFELHKADGDHGDMDIGKRVHEVTRNMGESVAPMVKFCYRMLVAEGLRSDSELRITESWERTIDTLLSKDAEKKKNFEKFLQESLAEDEFVDSLSVLLLAIQKTFSMGRSPDVLDCQELFVQLLSAAPRQFRQSFVAQHGYKEVLAGLDSADRLTRRLGARSFGILFSEVAVPFGPTSPLPRLQSVLDGWSSTGARGLNDVSGALEALSYVIGRMLFNKSSSPELLSAANKLHATIAGILTESKESLILDSAYIAVSQLSLWLAYGGHLTFPPAEKDTFNVITLVEKLAGAAKRGDEKAVLALGRFSVWMKEDKADILKSIYEKLHECHEIRATESQFTVGEALVCLAFGLDNTSIKAEYESASDSPKGPERPDFAAEIIDKTIKDCGQPKPALRHASVIWLLSLLEFAGHHTVVQDRLRDCQKAFKFCLGDRNELVQEASARGLGLVYSKGDNDLKDTLMHDFIGSFSEEKSKIGGTVTEDTELFDEGSLRTKDGSVTKYKDILNLASEVGDPSLVYKFMSLAATNSIWTSRAAFGKFGLSPMLLDSSIDAYLEKNPKFYPALYRYQFVPNKSVQETMKFLWRSLVKDPSATLDKYFNNIIQDLLKTMVGSDWRNREASLRAMSDLIQDRKFEKYERYLADIWRSTSRVMDDFKGSVREAAQALARTLSNILVKNLEAGESAKASGPMLDYTIPFLLSTQGIEAKAKQVQAWAVGTLLLIAQKSRGTVLEKHVAEIMDALLALFSSLEPEFINYAYQNSTMHKISAQEIDELRLKMSAKSPLMEGIDKLLDLPHTDDKSTIEIVKTMEQAITSGLGVPSLAAGAGVLGTMFLRHHLRFKPYADGFLKAVRKPLLDRNSTVSAAYAYATGYVARQASDEHILKLTSFAWDQWSTSEDDQHRSMAAEVFGSIANLASTRFSELSEDMLPYVFIGKHDDQEDVRVKFEKVWSDTTSGPRLVLLHLKKMVELAASLLDSPKWRLKHAGAKSIAEAAEVVATLDKMVSAEPAKQIWPAVVRAVGGRTWDGKEIVLNAFAKLVVEVRPLWELHPDIAIEVNKIVLREAKRQNRPYQQFSYPALGRVANARTDLDMSGTVLEIVSETVDSLMEKEDAMEVDGDEEKVKDSVRDEIFKGAVFAGQEAFGSLAYASKGKFCSSSTRRSANMN